MSPAPGGGGGGVGDDDDDEEEELNKSVVRNSFLYLTNHYLSISSYYHVIQ